MMAGVAQRVGIFAMIAVATTAALGFLLAAWVAWLAAVLGTAAALALTGAGFLVMALALGLVLRSQARAARRRQASQAALFGLVELALILLPGKHLKRVEAGLAAGVGLAAILAVILRPQKDPRTPHSAQEAPAGDGAEPQTEG